MHSRAARVMGDQGELRQKVAPSVRLKLFSSFMQMEQICRGTFRCFTAGLDGFLVPTFRSRSPRRTRSSAEHLSSAGIFGFWTILSCSTEEHLIGSIAIVEAGRGLPVAT